VAHSGLPFDASWADADGETGAAGVGLAARTPRAGSVDVRGDGGATAGRLRLAELVAALSLATDLGTGQPLEHALRTCLLSLELSRRSGVGASSLADVYYVALLRFVGCTADAAETAGDVGGDDIGFLAGMAPAWMGSSGEQLRALARVAGAGLPLPKRAGRLAGMLADPRGAARSLAAHCEAAQLLSVRLGMGPGVTEALGRAYERWDGAGLPGHVAGEEVPAPVRVVVLARDVDLWIRIAGVDAAVDVVRRRSGHAYDPSVAAAFCDDPRGVLEACRSGDAWTATLDAEPAPWITIGGAGLERALRAFGDFADLKSPWLRGHSPGVAALAGAAGAGAGLGVDEVATLRLAGMVHDLGRVGVQNGVWDRAGPLTVDGWEKVRLHPYLTERILSRAEALAPLARVAACHHERSDGAGYHRGALRGQLSRAERLLAVADAYHAMLEPRPHRPALGTDGACAELRRDVREGRFDAADVEAVLAATGHRPHPARMVRPAGLTEREVEVLRLIARGRSNPQVASDLTISPKTVGAHVEHIYAKAGVSTRAGAALFAMEHELL
jgi:HD-GYP domain-containing protein (c-di-GMP phosphodiesterase class II)